MKMCEGKSRKDSRHKATEKATGQAFGEHHPSCEAGAQDSNGVKMPKWER